MARIEKHFDAPEKAQQDWIQKRFDKNKSKWYFPTSEGEKMEFKVMIDIFTEALKVILESKSATTNILCKAAKSQERGNIRKWSGKTKGGRSYISVVSP